MLRGKKVQGLNNYVNLLVIYTCLGSVDNSHNNQKFAPLIYH